MGGAGDDLLNAAEPLDTILSNNAFLPYSSSQNTASQLAEAVFSANSGINIISASYSGADQAVSFFSSFSYGLGQLGSGILLTSGNANPPAQNTSTGFGLDNAVAGDAQLNETVNQVFNTSNYDASVLSIDFTVSDVGMTQISHQ